MSGKGLGIGARGISLGFGGADAQFLISQDETITVGSTDYPTFADAWNFAKQAVLSSGSILTIQLPDTGNTPIVDAFVEEIVDRDYGQIMIQGAPKVSGVATGLSGFGGSVGAYTVTFTVPAAVAASAQIHGFMLVEGAIRPASANNAKCYGYHRVVSTTATTVTVMLTSQSTMTAPTFVAGAYVCTVFSSMFKATDKNWGIKGTRAVLPILKDVSFIGGRYDAGYAPANQHRAIYLVDGSIGQAASVGDPTTLASTEPMISVAIHGFLYGLSQDASTWTGAIAISSNTNWGNANGSNAEVYATQMIITNCSGFGLGLDNARGTVSPYAVWRPSVFAGNAASGISGFGMGDLRFAFGAVIGNVGTDVSCIDSSRFRLGGTTDLLYGTVSPAINTLGNNNAYIRGY